MRSPANLTGRVSGNYVKDIQLLVPPPRVTMAPSCVGETECAAKGGRHGQAGLDGDGLHPKPPKTLLLMSCNICDRMISVYVYGQ